MNRSAERRMNSSGAKIRSIWDDLLLRCSEGALPPVPEGRSDRSLARSAWTAPPQKSRPVGYGLNAPVRAPIR